MWQVVARVSTQNEEKDTEGEKGLRNTKRVVVEKKKLNKESVSGPVGFGPQAQSVEAHGWC
jgi:hypothetical protein